MAQLGKPSRFSYTTNGVANPTLHMQPGEVQRWRLLNATDGDNLQMVLQGHGLNVVAMDAITVPNTYLLNPGDPLVIGPGQRMDVMVKAGLPGTYLLQVLSIPIRARYKHRFHRIGIYSFPTGSLRG